LDVREWSARMYFGAFGLAGDEDCAGGGLFWVLDRDCGGEMRVDDQISSIVRVGRRCMFNFKRWADQYPK